MTVRATMRAPLRIQELRMYARPVAGATPGPAFERLLRDQGHRVYAVDERGLLVRRIRFRQGLGARLEAYVRRVWNRFIKRILPGANLYMADLVTNLGLQDGLDNWFGNINDPIDAMGVSNFGTILAGTTTIAAASFKVVNVLASKVRSGQVVTAVADFTSGEISGNNITTITLHNDGNDAFTGVQGGVDAQDLTFSSVDITVELDVTGTSG